MTEQKFILILLLGLCLIVSAAAQECTDDEINTCRTDHSLELYGHPALLNVPQDQRTDFCTNIELFGTCTGDFIDACDFNLRELITTYLNMGLFLCDTQIDYARFYDEVIVKAGYPAAYEACVQAYDFDGEEDTTAACNTLLPTYVGCHEAVVSSESEEAQAYVTDFVVASLADYYEHYGCIADTTVPTEATDATEGTEGTEATTTTPIPGGTEETTTEGSAVGLTSSLIITSLATLLGSTFY